MANILVSPSQYVLGGVSAPRRGVSESFQAGLQANLGRQDTRQAMQAREQQMQINAAAERRAQQSFDLALQDRERAQAQAAAAASRAAASRAQYQNYLDQLYGAVTGGGAATPAPAPAAGVRPPSAGVNVPGGFQTGTPVGGGPSAAVQPAAPAPIQTAGLSFGNVPTAGMPAAPAAPLQVAGLSTMNAPSTAGVQLAYATTPEDAFRLAMETRPDLFGVQTADATGAIPAPQSLFSDPLAMPPPQTPYRDPRMYGVALVYGGDTSPAYQSIRLREFISARPTPSAVETVGFVPVDMSGTGIGMAGTVEYNPRTSQVRDPVTGQQLTGGTARVVAETYYRNLLKTQSDTQLQLAVLQSRFDRGNASADDLAQYNALTAQLQNVEAQLATTPTGVEALAGPFVQRNVFAEEGPGATGLAVPAAPAAAAAAAPAPTAPTAPIAPAAGLALPTGGPGTFPAAGMPELETQVSSELMQPSNPVRLAFSGPDAPMSEAYTGVPQRLFVDQNALAQSRQLAQIQLDYARQTGSAEGILAAAAQIQELDQAQRYLDGMTAIESLRRGDPAFVQALLQQNVPNEAVQVRLITGDRDNVQVLVNGEVVTDMSRSEFVDALRMQYDTQYMAAVAAAQALETDLNVQAREAEIESTARMTEAAYQSLLDTERERAVAAASRAANIEWTDIENGMKTAVYTDAIGNTYMLRMDPMAQVVPITATGSGEPIEAVMVYAQNPDSGLFDIPVHLGTDGIIYFVGGNGG